MGRTIYQCAICKKGWMRTYIKDGFQHWRYVGWEALYTDDVFHWKICPACQPKPAEGVG